MANKKIPADATKVFSTKLFEVYTKEQEQFNGSFKTFERVRTYDIAKAICIVDDEIIVLHEEKPGGSPKIWIPGGMLELHEEPDAAVRREVEEETGIVFDVYEKLTAIESNVGLVEAYRYFYIARQPRVFGEARLDAGWEKITQERISFEMFLDMIVHKNKFSGLSAWLIEEYILPGKTEELRKLLFGN